MATAYTAPSEARDLDTSTLGFTNGFLLKFPRPFASGDVSLRRLPPVAIRGARQASPWAGSRARPPSPPLPDARSLRARYDDPS